MQQMIEPFVSDTGETQHDDAIRTSRPSKSPHQERLERSDLWKLHRAIIEGADLCTLVMLSREANAEFVRNLTDHQVVR